MSRSCKNSAGDAPRQPLGYSLTWLLILLLLTPGQASQRPFRASSSGPCRETSPSCRLGVYRSHLGSSWHYDLTRCAGIPCIMVRAAALISHWFMRSRGAAMASAPGPSSALFSSTLAHSDFGWRHTLDVFGLIILLGLGPLGALLFRRHPPDVGAVPYDTRLPARKPPGHPQPTTTRTQGLTLGAALRTYQLWAVFALCGASASSAIRS